MKDIRRPKKHPLHDRGIHHDAVRSVRYWWNKNIINQWPFRARDVFDGAEHHQGYTADLDWPRWVNLESLKKDFMLSGDFDDDQRFLPEVLTRWKVVFANSTLQRDFVKRRINIEVEHEIFVKKDVWHVRFTVTPHLTIPV